MSKKKFFGGEDGFKYLKTLDERKRLLCLENGCELFYFTYTQKDVPQNYPYKIYTNEKELFKIIKQFL